MAQVAGLVEKLKAIISKSPLDRARFFGYLPSYSLINQKPKEV
jgi:hypothetical protein